MHPKDIAITDYTYHLPEEKIAAFPLQERDASKLLVFKNGSISQDSYRNLADHLPLESLLVFNDTKVIQARLLFTKETGGVIEIFCLEPYELVNEYSVIMKKTGSVRWKCMIGGAGKWKTGHLQKTVPGTNGSVTLKAALIEKLADAYVVELSWQPANYSFAEVLELTGDIPLPPYIKRKAADIDKDRYQTIYAAHKGSVAAPTAGLHFTPAIFQSLWDKKIKTAYVTLHVGAGTFKPVKAASLAGHEMHSEWMDVPGDLLTSLLQNTGPVIAVGTTSVRTLESLYWMGVKAFVSPNITAEQIIIRQWDVYEAPLAEAKLTATEALNALKTWMDNNNLQHLFLPTQILITPGYQYRMVKVIVTNFHQPQSTLLLLVAAAIGDSWSKVYDYALKNDFRFLSYGDGSLLFISQ